LFAFAKKVLLQGGNATVAGDNTRQYFKEGHHRQESLMYYNTPVIRHVFIHHLTSVVLKQPASPQRAIHHVIAIA
jgi:hypothetical protein